MAERSGREIDPRLLEGMAGDLARRGPDGQGTFISPRSSSFAAGLAHTRLSIIDLSPAGAQPMPNEDGSVLINFNGEIYNFQELRSELQAKGHRFRSRTDTETIIHGYEEYGDGIIGRLNGMFALALLDLRQKRLLLARDRFGQKPLYYFETKTGIVFASLLRTLLLHPDCPREIDPQGLSRYLLHEYVPDPHTLIRSLKKLPPGRIMTWDESGSG